MVTNMNTNTWLYPFPGLHQRQIEEHLALQNDSRTWTTKDSYKPSRRRSTRRLLDQQDVDVYSV